MKRSLLSIAALACAVAVQAEPVALETARSAAQAWIDRGYSMDCLVGKCAAGGETIDADGVRLHLIRLSGGGFLVMGADDRVEPVLAFSSTGCPSPDGSGPFWKIVKADAAQRAKALAATGAGSSRLLLSASAPGSASARTAAQKRWDALVGRGQSAGMRLKLGAVSPVEAVSDVRVPPLVKSKWGQTINSIYDDYGDNCYNYYTPYNYPCGCVVTIMSQVMRYHCYPLSYTGSQKEWTCMVSGVATRRQIIGGNYDYQGMPLVPEGCDDGVPWYESGATEEQRKAIGRLTYDCGVAMQMNWNAEESVCGGACVGQVLKNTFGYKNYKVDVCIADLADPEYRSRVICSNLDAGFPVLIGYEVHEVLADGYGYSDGVLYTHLNMGWSGEDDMWYVLPEVRSSDGDYRESTIRTITYNLFPRQTGEIVSGRVLDDGGNPVFGASVTISKKTSKSSVVVSSTTTSESGVYAFVVPAGCEYEVEASYEEARSSVRTGVVLSSEVSEATLKPGMCVIPNSALTRRLVCGNVWGCDLVLEVMPVAAPVLEPAGCLFYPSTNVSISCATPGATIRYTTDGSEPGENSAEYLGPIEITADAVVKAKAFKQGMNASVTVRESYVYDQSIGAPPGDYYIKPIAIDGAKGYHEIADNSGYGVEDGELEHAAWYYEWRTAWYRWTAPSRGRVTFTTKGVMDGREWGYDWVTMLTAVAVYPDFDSMPTSYEEQLAADFSENFEPSTVTLTVERGKSYRVVGIETGYDNPGSFLLEWNFEPNPESKREIRFDAGAWSESEEMLYDYGSELGELPEPERTDYEFAGWFTDVYGGEQVFPETVVTESAVYHAHWRFVGTPFLDVSVSDDCAGMGSVTGGNKHIAAGTKVKLTAKAAKGFVFRGWYKDGAPLEGPADYQSASYTYEVEEGIEVIEIEARFATKNADAASVVLYVESGGPYDVYAAIPVVTNYCGVSVKCPVSSSALSQTTVKASNLPKGLKFALDKSDGTYYVTGVVTAKSAADKKTGLPTPAKVKFTVTTAGGSSKKFTVGFVFLPLPPWAVGSFAGWVEDAASGECGPATMSVTAAGKVSGKYTLFGTNWTFSAGSYAASDVSGGRTNLTVAASAASGKAKRTLALDLRDVVCAELPGAAASEATGEVREDGAIGASASCTLYRLPWSDKGEASAYMAACAGTYTCTATCVGGDKCPVAFSLDEKGAMKGTAEDPGETHRRVVSFTSNAIAAEGGVFALVAVASDLAGKPSVFALERLVGHYGAPEAGFAYRDPGVFAYTEPLTPGSGAGGTVSASPKYGQAAAGGTVTLTAKAKSGSVFSRWEVGPEVDVSGLNLSSPTLKLAVPANSDVAVVAKFVTKAEDAASVRLFIEGEGPYDPSAAIPVVTNYCGVSVKCPVSSSALSQTTVKASNLPKGLKFALDKSDGTYYVTGVVTAKSAADKKTGLPTPAKVKFTVTTAGGSSKNFTVGFVFLPLP